MAPPPGFGSADSGKTPLVTKLAEIQACDGFHVDAGVGEVGIVEETWLDETGHATALAVRAAGDRIALLLAEDVADVDVDAQEVLVRPGARLLELEPPRGDGRPSAEWRTTGAVVPLEPTGNPGAEVVVPWQTAVKLVTAIAVILGVQMGLAFLVAYLVTGHAY